MPKILGILNTIAITKTTTKMPQSGLAHEAEPLAFAVPGRVIAFPIGGIFGSNRRAP